MIPTNETCPATATEPDLDVQLTCILVKQHDLPDQHVDKIYGYWYGDDVTDYSLTGE